MISSRASSARPTQAGSSRRCARFAGPSLSLHPDKTRLIEFGRHAAAQRAQREQSKPETFAFLGFTFISGKSCTGKFLIHRKSRRDSVTVRVMMMGLPHDLFKIARALSTGG